MESSVYLINRMPTHVLQNKSSFACLFHRTPDYNFLRTFGCLCFLFLRPYHAHKLDFWSSPYVFLGYSSSHLGYRCLDLESGCVYVSRHVRFHECVFSFKKSEQVTTLPVPPTPPTYLPSLHLPSCFQPIPSQISRTHNSPLPLAAPPQLAPLPVDSADPASPPHTAILSPRACLSNDYCAGTGSELQDSVAAQPSTSPASPPGLQFCVDLSSYPLQHIPGTGPATPCPAAPKHPMVLRPRQPKTALTTTTAATSAASFSRVASPPSHEPLIFPDANRYEAWHNAMREEIQALRANRTWTLVPFHPSMNVIGSRWVYKIKRRSDGSIERYKARLVARGFTQQEGIDYSETFSPVIKQATVRLVFSIAVSSGWKIHQLDIHNAFLNGVLDEEVYMKQPPGFVDSALPGHVCRLHKSLYGLKQAPRAWYTRLNDFLLSIGFHASKVDTSLFIFSVGSDICYLLVYVDDILLTGNNVILLQRLIQLLSSEFKLRDLGDVHYFLGIEVQCTGLGLMLCQHKYTLDILTRAGMLSCKPVDTPISASKATIMPDPLFSDATRFRQLVGALQYLTFTRPDICFAVNRVCQFMHAPTESHRAAVKRILRYLRGTASHDLHITRSSSFALHGFTDADWAGSIEDRKSTGGYLVFFGQTPISWKSSKQRIVARSSTEAEYKALADGTAEVIWLQYLLTDLQIPTASAPIIWCDNLGATYLSANPVFHARTKHIEIDYHFVRDRVAKKEIQIRFISSRDQLADVFTKPLPASSFTAFRFKLRVDPPSSA